MGCTRDAETGFVDLRQAGQVEGPRCDRCRCSVRIRCGYCSPLPGMDRPNGLRMGSPYHHGAEEALAQSFDRRFGFSVSAGVGCDRITPDGIFKLGLITSIARGRGHGTYAR